MFHTHPRLTGAPRLSAADVETLQYVKSLANKVPHSNNIEVKMCIRDRARGTVAYYVSDSTEQFDRLAHVFLGEYAGGSVQLMTRGSFVKRGGSFFITYKETQATGYEGCVTTVKVEGSDKVSMLRFGPAPSQLVIERGKRHVCHYETGQGALSLGVAADEIHSRLSEKGGRVRFSYMLDVDDASVSRNIVDITVKPTI